MAILLANVHRHILTTTHILVGVQWMVGIKHWCDVSSCPQHDLVFTPRVLGNKLADIVHLVAGTNV